LRVLGAASGGEPHRSLRWNDWAWVTHVAPIFLRNGEPFSQIDALTVARLRDAQMIRNRVAHDSTKARHQFKRCVNSLKGQTVNSALPRGFTPGEFLADEAPVALFCDFNVYPAEQHTWGDFFECFVAMFFEASVILSPTAERPAT